MILINTVFNLTRPDCPTAELINIATLCHEKCSYSGPKTFNHMYGDGDLLCGIHVNTTVLELGYSDDAF
jgi:hypothetical protein